MRHSCSLTSSCEECAGSNCLWCPSLQHCTPNNVYPFSYIYGQCLGWVSHISNCSGNCSDYRTCSDCQSDPHCGWCNDPSDTGLGECSDGGFTTPMNTSFCVEDGSDRKMHERWFFGVCPGGLQQSWYVCCYVLESRDGTAKKCRNHSGLGWWVGINEREHCFGYQMKWWFGMIKV